MDPTVPFIFSAEGLSVGSDYGDSVAHENYRTTFDFNGRHPPRSVEAVGPASTELGMGTEILDAAGFATCVLAVGGSTRRDLPSREAPSRGLSVTF